MNFLKWNKMFYNYLENIGSLEYFKETKANKKCVVNECERLAFYLAKMPDKENELKVENINGLSYVYLCYQHNQDMSEE